MTDPSLKIHNASLICRSTPSSSIYVISDLFFFFLFIFQFGSAYIIYQESQSIKVYKHLEENADDPSQDLPFSKKHFLGSTTYFCLVLSNVLGRTRVLNENIYNWNILKSVRKLNLAWMGASLTSLTMLWDSLKYSGPCASNKQMRGSKDLFLLWKAFLP